MSSVSNSCWSTNRFNPTTWEPKKVMWTAIVIALICAVAIAICALSNRFPEASGAFYTAFGVGLGVATIATIVSLVRLVKSKEPLEKQV